MSETTRSGIPHFFLNVARIVFGLMFMQHGAQKLFALLGREEAAAFLSQIWFAGALEFWGGLLIVVGLFTRPVAFVLAGEMAWAYFQVHAPRSFFPIQNGGETSVLFCFFFLLLAAAGGGRFSLDGLMANRRSRRLG
ncbi:MAG: DoxX family protein [Longimicrobiales bacterium]